MMLYYGIVNLNKERNGFNMSCESNFRMAIVSKDSDSMQLFFEALKSRVNGYNLPCSIFIDEKWLYMKNTHHSNVMGILRLPIGKERKLEFDIIYVFLGIFKLARKRTGKLYCGINAFHIIFNQKSRKLTLKHQ